MADQNGSTRPRRRASLPLIAGSLIAAAGLVFGGIATASANHASANHGHANHASHHPRPHPMSTVPPKHGDAIPNVTLVENQIKAYYGSVSGTIGTDNRAVTLPDPKANYAKEMRHLVARAKVYFTHAMKQWKNHNHGSKKPALIFDIDDTTLNTYDYEIFSNFAYNPTTNQDFVNNADFPRVFAMPSFVNWAHRDGYSIFFLTGRPEHQRAGTVTNLTRAGYKVPLDTSHVYLKYESGTTPPSYITCTGTGGTCTTIDYKSGTRAHIASTGYRILGDFGDQLSDLKGGHSGHKVKLPNPMYYLP